MKRLAESRAQEGGRLEKGLSREVEASCKRQMAWLEREIRKALQDDEKMARRTALHQSVKGVGEATAALITGLPELRRRGGKAPASLVGLAPWSRDSGKRSIRGGRVVCRASYRSAWSAVRHDPETKRFYESLRRRGKSGKAALVAVMRKMLLPLNAIARRGRRGWSSTPQQRKKT